MRRSFLTTCEAFFDWFVLVSYSRTFRKLKKLYLCFQQHHVQFDYTEIDHMVRIEIFLSNDCQHRRALFVSSITKFSIALSVWYSIVYTQPTPVRLAIMFYYLLSTCAHEWYFQVT